ncbi:MAG TPA: hypothetical protein VFL15_11100 [Gammaproteobacteria bacterium]|nr:hypothetical protein [Gammaproteobacteria bacterium]
MWFGALIVGATVLPCRAATGQPWSLAFGVADGVTSGWVQVRENSIAGSRLGFQNDLGVSHAPAQRLTLQHLLNDAGYWQVSLQSLTLQGTAIPSHDVYFNGTTLLAGKPLSSTTRFPDFVALEVLRGFPLFTFENGGRLNGELGARYTALTFYMAGTIASNSVGHETKEDFVTQELPIPAAAVRLRYPLSDLLSLISGASVAYLPWLNSLRHEGGVVRLRQLEDRLEGGMSYAVSSTFKVNATAYYSYFSQHERSEEDDNTILLESRGVELQVQYLF